MTDSKALIERLRADWPEILVEKHWMMDSDAIEEQRREAADHIEELDRHLTLSGKVNKAMSEHIEKLEADNARLHEALETIAAECCIPVGTDKQMYARWRALAASRVDVARAALAKRGLEIREVEG